MTCRFDLIGRPGWLVRPEGNNVSRRPHTFANQAGADHVRRAEVAVGVVRLNVQYGATIVAL